MLHFPALFLCKYYQTRFTSLDFVERCTGWKNRLIGLSWNAFWEVERSVGGWKLKLLNIDGGHLVTRRGTVAGKLHS